MTTFAKNGFSGEQASNYMIVRVNVQPPDISRIGQLTTPTFTSASTTFTKVEMTSLLM